MKVPSFLAPYVAGDSPKRLIQGMAVGAVAAMVIGFNWGGWDFGSIVDQKVEAASSTATVAALAPICADKFERAVKDDASLLESINAINAWQRNSYLTQAGWTTFPGGAGPSDRVAGACLVLLKEALDIK